jgi:hypothetical protein
MDAGSGIVARAHAPLEAFCANPLIGELGLMIDAIVREYKGALQRLACRLSAV